MGIDYDKRIKLALEHMIKLARREISNEPDNRFARKVKRICEAQLKNLHDKNNQGPEESL